MKIKKPKNKKGCFSKNYYISYFLDVLVSEKFCTKNTLDSYRSDLEKLEEFLLENGTTLVSAVKVNIKDYIKLLYKKCKGSSVLRKLSVTRHFYKVLSRDGIIGLNPVPIEDEELKSPKSLRSLPQHLSTEEMTLLLGTIRKSAEKETNSKRTCALLDILYSSGIRISELISIKLSDALRLVSASEEYIIIKGKGFRERQVLLNKDAVKSLKSYLLVRSTFLHKGKESEWLFPGDSPNKPITRQRVGQLIKELAKKCNIDTNKISPHVFRHSFATHLLNGGADILLIQKVLGHANLATTQIYTYIANEQLKKKLAKSHPINHMVSD